MKGIILAGGLGSRLYPLTYATNKHLLPVYNQPMIYYPIKTLVDAGIDEILIVVGGPHAGNFIQVLKNGKDLGIKHLEYAYQEGVGGIAAALALAEDFADNQSIAVILGDNTTDADLKSTVDNFKEGATVFLKKVDQPEHYGVPVFGEDNKTILTIEEKPSKPKSSFAVTGLYFYDNSVFDIIRTLKPSDRGELEITDVNNVYLAKGQLNWQELKGFWKDAGSFDTLVEVNQFWANKIKLTK